MLGGSRSQKAYSTHAKAAKYNLELAVKVHEFPAKELNHAIESIARLAEVCGDLKCLHINVESAFDTQGVLRAAWIYPLAIDCDERPSATAWTVATPAHDFDYEAEGWFQIATEGVCRYGREIVLRYGIATLEGGRRTEERNVEISNPNWEIVRVKVFRWMPNFGAALERFPLHSRRTEATKTFWNSLTASR
jgi:hypothetical protein